MAITKEQLLQLQKIGVKIHRSEIYEAGTLNGKTVYELRYANLRPRAKVGYPILYVFTPKGIAQLNYEQMCEVIRQPSFRNGCKRIQ